MNPTSRHVRAAAVLAAALAMTGPPVACAAPATPFNGHWHSHGAALDITGETATIVVSTGPCGPSGAQMCHETDHLSVRSADETGLDLVVTAVDHSDSGGAAVPPRPGPATAVGDSMHLSSQGPGLLKRTSMQGFPGWSGGNPYWCGAGISPADVGRCGA